MSKIDRETLNRHIGVVNQTIEWSSQYLSNKSIEQQELRSNLVENRRCLERISSAMELNPAVAVFGQSQVGKSYLVDGLLANANGPLTVSNGLDGEDYKEYGFLEHIDPQGRGQEATAVVSRFTTKVLQRPAAVPNDYAFRVELLSVKDILLVLVDAYYNDVKFATADSDEGNSSERNYYTKDELLQHLDRLKQKYANHSVCQSYLTEGDVYALRDYFIGAKANNIYLQQSRSGIVYGEYLQSLETTEVPREYVRSGFFEGLGAIISRVPLEELPSVLSFLWCDTPVFTQAFKDLFNLLRQFNFARTVYIKIDAILRIKGTILHVRRINEYYDPNIDKSDVHQYEALMSVFADGVEHQGINKGLFCALTKELVFQISQDLIKTKPFLEHLDLLDFPGARSRGNKNIEEPGVMGEFLRRGKIAYLFNDYSANYKINNLIFCHFRELSEVTSLKKLIGGWVFNCVGRTPEERNTYLSNLDVAPLFIVSTMFNKDMIREAREDLTTNFEGRWSTRFGNLEAIFSDKDYSSWFMSWTSPTTPFKNSYLLRSYEWSTSLFDGYMTTVSDGAAGNRTVVARSENGEIIGEQAYVGDSDRFLAAMGKSFADYKYVREHFADPHRSWQEATSVAKDGSAWIIENLYKASLDTTRINRERFAEQYKLLSKLLGQHIKEKFHDDDADKSILNALNTAGNIEMRLDSLFGKDKHFFSQFLSRMMISEKEIHDTLLTVLNNPRMLEETDTSRYFAVRDKAKIDPTDSREANIERIRTYYYKDTAEDVYKYLEEEGLDIDTLLSPTLAKNTASILIDSVVELWVKDFMASNRFKDFVTRGFKESDLNNLLANIIALFETKLDIPSLITDRIAKYVKKDSTLDTMTEMLADMCSEMINCFVASVGYDYYNKDLWNNIVTQNEEQELNLDVYPDNYTASINAENRAEIEQVFQVLDDIDEVLNQTPPDPKKLCFIPHYAEYKRWTALMKISFIATSNIPVYDIVANDALRTIVEEYKGLLVEH